MMVIQLDFQVESQTIKAARECFAVWCMALPQFTDKGTMPNILATRILLILEICLPMRTLCSLLLRISLLAMLHFPTVSSYPTETNQWSVNVNFRTDHERLTNIIRRALISAIR